jgi:hypothetical protein
MSDARQVKELLRARVTELAPYLYPNGKREGVHWCVGSVNGEPGKSFKICLTGEKAGMWGDFADSEKHRRSLLDLWMTARNVEFNTALREAGQWLGVSLNGSNGAALNRARPSNGNGAKPKVEPLNWNACTEAFSEKHFERLAQWRGWPIEFCRELNAMRLVGLYNHALHGNCLALPVHDSTGKVVKVQCRKKDGNWCYDPTDIKTTPLVIGELNSGDPVHVFESPLDAFSFMHLSGDRSGIIGTRGAGNGALVAGLAPQGSTVYAWKQNDELKNGKRAGDEWLKAVMANTRAKVLWAKTPGQHKDLNDWLRAGATADDLLAAMMNAELIREAKSESPVSPDITQPQPFPVRCLFPGYEAMARAICDTVRVLESLPGCCILGILSAAIGSGLQVKSGPNRVTRGNLYILASAESGSGKSETFRHTAKPFHDFEAQLVLAWKSESKPGLLAEQKVLEAEIAALTKSGGKANGSTEREEICEQLREKIAALENVETKLRTPALSCEDVTGEKLAVLLAHNNEQMASLSADALAIINILLGRYNKLDRTDEGIYLKAFTGDRCKVDRQSRESVLVESPCLAALWLTQPDKLESLLAERSLSDGGLIPRILPCHTHCEAREIVKGVPGIPSITENAYADLIRSLIETYRRANEPFTIEPTSEALEAMNAHHNKIVKRRKEDLRDVTIYAASWSEQAWRLSVVLHAAQHGARAHQHKLELDTANRAIELQDWFASQQLEILSATRYKARREIWDRVLTLLDDKLEGIRASDVYHLRIARNADEAHALLAAMESEGELSGRDEQPERGGHVTRVYTRST